MMKDLYKNKNPFSGVNASQLSIESILEYWCNPFLYNVFPEINEKDIYQEEMNIVFMGGRSTGKSMFLRYWSYPVQFKKSDNEKEPLLNCIKKHNGIGFYFRIDGPILRSFSGNGIDIEHWNSVFIHYFELLVAHQYLDVIKILIQNGVLNENIINDILLPKLNELIGRQSKSSLNELILYLDNKIKEVDTYRGNVPFSKKQFIPYDKGFSSQSLSFGIAEIILNSVDELKDINIIILLDEYENFLEYQQVVINTLLRFSRSNIKFRIGMRLEGFKTFKMIADEDFIMEGREYRKVTFEEVVNQNKGHSDLLIEISKKRLESIEIFKEKGLTNIKKILLDNENLEEEALDIVKNNPNRIIEYFSNILKKDISKNDLEKIRYSKNPLFEILNFIWLLRGETIVNIISAMNDYINNIKSDKAKKYKNDYINKYKYSLLILLCSIYKKNKLYYSFNTFKFLSSGIIGNFIELCNRSFAFATYGDYEKLINEGIISKEHQSKAALDVSKTVREQINRIEEYGTYLYKFITNIGIIFREYHRDYKIRYPETNQFSINIESINNENIKNSIKSAIRWSLIQKKPKLQRTDPSGKLQDTYIINRIFSPSFELSYRTRGGKSLLLDESTLIELMKSDNINTKKYLHQNNNEKDEIENQPDLFSQL